MLFVYIVFFVKDHANVIHTYFPAERPQRQKFLADYIKNMGGNVTFKIYEGIGHEIPDQMLEDALDFLTAH